MINFEERTLLTYSALDEEVKKILKKAEERAKANQRRTILARDL